MSTLTPAVVVKDMKGMSPEASAKYCMSSQFETANADVLRAALDMITRNILGKGLPLPECEIN